MSPWAMKLRPQAQGAQFELIFLKICRLKGFWARKTPLSARLIGHGRIIPIKSELDWVLIHPDHPVAFLDTKSFQGSKFRFSDLDQHQVKLANSLNEWNQVSGFICWFRESNVISYFSGHQVVTQGPNTSFQDVDGVVLGNVPNFEIRKIFY